MTYFDAHCHLQDIRLIDYLEDIVSTLKARGVERVVVNGTCEKDWAVVSALAAKYPLLKPAFGLHPWEVGSESERWQDDLLTRLDSPGAAVGEIGLDRWVEGHDFEAQKNAFLFQYDLAQERGVPASIHCLKAWGALFDLLKSRGVSKKGFLLHSYGGPKEMVPEFVDLGAYFSFSGYFAMDRKAKQREAFLEVPLERLLIETDAPDMLGPQETVSIALFDRNGAQINHPGNLLQIYRYAASLFDENLTPFAQQIEENFGRLFGD